MSMYKSVQLLQKMLRKQVHFSACLIYHSLGFEPMTIWEKNPYFVLLTRLFLFVRVVMTVGETSMYSANLIKMPLTHVYFVNL